jgi:hypothetical protein
MDREIVPLFYQNTIIYIYLQKSGYFEIDEFSLSKLFNLTEKFFDEAREDSKFELDKHFSKVYALQYPLKIRKDLFLWNKKGLIRLAYILGREDVLQIVEDIEEIEFPDKREPLLFEIEAILKEQILEIKKSGNLSKMDMFLETLSKFLREKDALSKRQEGGIKNFITEMFNEVISKSDLKKV